MSKERQPKPADGSCDPTEAFQAAAARRWSKAHPEEDQPVVQGNLDAYRVGEQLIGEVEKWTDFSAD